jgi:putative peptide zinc metalloprotease protein
MSEVATEDLVLPELRQDLTLLKGPSNSEGVPTWNIFDAVRNRYFRIGWLAFQLLSRWSVGSANELIDKVNAETACQLSKKDIDDLLVFLYANSLTVSSASGNGQDYLDQYNSTKQHWLIWLIKNYLFIRIPLFRPHGFLKATLPYLEGLFSTSFRNAVIFLGLIGIYLVAREWDVFVNSFLYFFDAEGLMAYVVGLIFIKILHEFGHAYMATRYGAKVSTMGVAMLVMFPVLYTDTSNAWRLTSRKQRLHIGFAGMLVELYIACIATFVWAFMPDGILRSMAFVLATSSWILSLSINLNIFMRFDGYYILSDWWGVENLQRKSFSLGKWKLTEVLFGLNRVAPENVSRSTRNKLVLYSWGTWIYRFFLFLAIALIVYHLFFKLLGIILFVVEIVYFIIYPLIKQMKLWWVDRAEIAESKRSYITFSLFILFLLFCFTPWNTKIKVPAILEATEDVMIYAPISAMIKTILVSEGNKVEQGELIAALESSQLNSDINQARQKIKNIELILSRHASSAENLSNLHVVLGRLEEAKSEYQSLVEQIELLNIYSPINGVIVDIDDSIHERRWVNASIPLFNIVNQQQQITGMLSEKDIARVNDGDQAIFYPDNAQIAPIPGKVKDIENINMRYIEQLYFNSRYGGEVAVRQDEFGNYVPESGVYRITFMPSEGEYKFNYVLKGIVQVEGVSQSLMGRMGNFISKVAIRESGF